MDEATRLAFAEQVAEVAEMTMARLTETFSSPASPDFVSILFDLCCRAVLSLHQNSEHAKGIVKELCERSDLSHGEQAWSLLYKGCLHHLDGDHDLAVPAYLQAGAGAHFFWPTSNGCKSVALIEPNLSVSAGPNRGQQSDISLDFFRRAPRTSKPLVVLTTADAVYLQKFGDRYFQSVKKYAPEATVHLHLMNSDHNDRAAIDEAIFSGTWPEMTITLESVDLAERLPYFAYARFIHAAQFLNYYERPVLVTDIDAAFHAPLQSSLPPLDKIDVGLRIKKAGFRAHPWQTIQAGLFLACPTESGHRFCRDLGQHLTQLLHARAGQQLWFVDQNALYHLWLLYRLRHAALRVLDLAKSSLPGDLRFGKL